MPNPVRELLLAARNNERTVLHHFNLCCETFAGCSKVTVRQLRKLPEHWHSYMYKEKWQGEHKLSTLLMDWPECAGLGKIHMRVPSPYSVDDLEALNTNLGNGSRDRIHEIEGLLNTVFPESVVTLTDEIEACKSHLSKLLRRFGVMVDKHPHTVSYLMRKRIDLTELTHY